MQIVSQECMGLNPATGLVCAENFRVESFGKSPIVSGTPPVRLLSCRFKYSKEGRAKTYPKHRKKCAKIFN